MKTFSHFFIQIRFARRLFLLFMVTLIILSMIILGTKFLLNSFYKPNLIWSINTAQYHAPNRILDNEQSIDIIQSKIINQKLPFIHQPPSGSIVLRALLLFYPNDQDIAFQSEFRWFYRSWTEMMISESSLWRTDIIVYASEYTSLFKKLDCVYDKIRINSEEKPKCRFFPYVRMKNRDSVHASSSAYQTIDKKRAQIIYQNLRTYGYIDSINTVLEYYLSYSMYDFILRTDMDCFLTHNFARYVPYNNSIIVGRGGYSTEFNNRRLKRIANDMNWKYADKDSLGSTW